MRGVSPSRATTCAFMCCSAGPRPASGSACWGPWTRPRWLVRHSKDRQIPVQSCRGHDEERADRGGVLRSHLPLRSRHLHLFIRDYAVRPPGNGPHAPTWRFQPVCDSRSPGLPAAGGSIRRAGGHQPRHRGHRTRARLSPARRSAQQLRHESVTSTPAGAQTCSYRLDRAHSSFPVNGGSGSIRLTTTCDWEASSSEPWAQISTTAGAGTTAITLTVDPHVLPTPRTAMLTIAGQIVQVTQAGGQSDPPFGVIDTPADNASGIAGSLAVTGWALDDVGVSARPDLPRSSGGRSERADLRGRRDVRRGCAARRAGSHAVGALRVARGLGADGADQHAAERREWHVPVVGHCRRCRRPLDSAGDPGIHRRRTPRRRCRSAPSIRREREKSCPGTMVNFGWALTPQPEIIPTDGLDDRRGHRRRRRSAIRSTTMTAADIAALFPGYREYRRGRRVLLLRHDARSPTAGTRSPGL